MSPPLRSVRSRQEHGLQPTHHPDDAQPWRAAHDQGPSMSPLLLFSAAIAFQHGLLVPGSSYAFLIGVVCLAIAVGEPLLSRRRARRRPSRLTSSANPAAQRRTSP